MFDSVSHKYSFVTELLIEKKLTISTMESCTSGLIASLLTDTEGASAVFKGSFVTYCNEAKIRCGVPAEVIDEFGVYSPETAEAMAQACRRGFGTDIGIGVTGTFNNADPSNRDSVPGIVYFSISFKDALSVFRIDIENETTRSACKLKAADEILSKLICIINESL